MSKFDYLIPNFITGIRIICAVVILFVVFPSLSFFYLYLICGLTDVLDGYIARKLEVTTSFGAVLDSIADTLFFLALVVTLFVRFIFPIWVIAWIFLIIIIRFSSLFIGFSRYGVFSFLHTLSNKFTGLVIFFLPFLIIISCYDMSISICCFIATISAVEELLINVLSNKLDRNISSICSLKK